MDAVLDTTIGALIAVATLLLVMLLERISSDHSRQSLERVEPLDPRDELSTEPRRR